MSRSISLRDCQPDELEALYRLFVASVHGLAHSAYEHAQLHAWAPLGGTTAHGGSLFQNQRVRVAEVDGNRAGFISFQPPDEIGLLYVLPSYARQGIASALHTDLEMRAFEQGVRCLHVHASHLARPFFVTRGYAVLGENRVERNGVALSNWMMEKTL